MQDTKKIELIDITKSIIYSAFLSLLVVGTYDVLYGLTSLQTVVGLITFWGIFSIIYLTIIRIEQKINKPTKEA